MPLSATYLGVRIESWSMTPEEWSDLKRNYRTSVLTMTCGQAGVPKTSPLGTQFFSHKASSWQLMWVMSQRCFIRRQTSWLRQVALALTSLRCLREDPDAEGVGSHPFCIGI